MASTVKRIPEGHHSVLPHLSIRGAAEAIEFYKKAFGATERGRFLCPQTGLVMHGEIQIGDSRLFLNDEFPQMGCLSPQSLNGTPVTIHLWVEDVDSVYDQAVRAGATPIMPVSDQFWGDRYGMLKDPFGHNWSIASRVKDMTPEEMAEAAKVAFASMSSCTGEQPAEACQH